MRKMIQHNKVGTYIIQMFDTEGQERLSLVPRQIIGVLKNTHYFIFC